MSWGETAQWSSFALALLVAGDRVVQWMLRKQFATTDDVLGVHKVLGDEQREHAARVTEAHHQIELLKQKLDSLPGYDQVNELKKDVAEVKQGNAVNGAKLDSLKETMELVRKSIEHRSLRP